MTRGSAPGRSISRAHSSGTASRPMRRAATAGNSASRSGVTVKMQLTIRSGPSALRSMISRISCSVERGCRPPRWGRRRWRRAARTGAWRGILPRGPAASGRGRGSPGALVPADPQGGVRRRDAATRSRCERGSCVRRGLELGAGGGLAVGHRLGRVCACTHLSADRARDLRIQHKISVAKPFATARSRRGEPPRRAGLQVAEPSGPKRVRRSAHRWPTASHMRRTWRLRPSWIVSSSSSAPRRRTSPAPCGRPRARRLRAAGAAPARGPAGGHRAGRSWAPRSAGG